MTEVQPSTETETETGGYSGITSKNKPRLFTGFANLLRRAEKDEYGCVTVTEKNFKSVVTRSPDNVLVVFYTDV